MSHGASITIGTANNLSPIKKRYARNITIKRLFLLLVFQSWTLDIRLLHRLFVGVGGNSLIVDQA